MFMKRGPGPIELAAPSRVQDEPREIGWEDSPVFEHQTARSRLYELAL